MQRTRTFLPLAAATAALGVAAAPASADRLVAQVPAGSTNLAYAGGVLAWAQPEGDGFRLALRLADGRLVSPDIPAFDSAPDPSIGTTTTDAYEKRLKVVYSRDGDIVAFDVAAGTEEPVKGASTRTYEETAPSLAQGRLSFVRSGGRRKGVFSLGLRLGRLVRISPEVASETAHNGSRVAYVLERGLVIERVSGRGRPLRAGAGYHSISLTRYQAAWLNPDSTISRSDRFAGSGVPYTFRARRSARQVPGIVSLAVGESTNRVAYIDAEGVKTAGGDLLR